MLLPIVVLIFLATFCLVIVGGLALAGFKESPKTELRRRLRQMARQGNKELPAEVRSEITREMTPTDRLLSRLPLARGLDRRLDRAGLRVTITTFVLISTAVSALLALIAILLTRKLWVAIPTTAGVVLGGAGYLRFLTQRRIDRFTEVFPDALTMIARSLRAGHSFNTAVQLVANEVADPVGELFKAAHDQQSLGLRIIESLSGLNDRIESLDLRFFTTVVSINTEVGGNLSEILEKLAETIKERMRIRNQVRVFTAQGRMSGYVLGALPVITFAAFSILNPSYESVLVREPLGIYILCAAVVLQLVGFLVIRRIIKIKI